MAAPVFEEYEPAADCPCPGCARRRRERALAPGRREGGHPAAPCARGAVVLVTAAGVALGAGGAPTALAAPPAAPAGVHLPSTATAPAHRLLHDPDDPDGSAPQGNAGPLHGRPLVDPVLRPTTRAQIMERAERWVVAKVPYSMEKFWSDGYRQDCSGYVSMAWNLAGNEWTGSLAAFGTRIERSELQPGDILLFHNAADPNAGSHATIFGGWVDAERTTYTAYEQARPQTRKQATPMAYWNNSAAYVAYRYKGLTTTTGGSPGVSARWPGAAAFGPGANNAHVTRLGRLLTERGGKRYYRSGPGPRWSDADRQATRAFQRAQGWKGQEADGLPGPHTWRLLVTGKGRDIAATGTPGASASPFPGRAHFRPGQSNAHVEKLGRQLVKRGFGRHYRSGPGPRWTEADRRNVEAFQRAQGWRGAAANGYPGPETWRRLFA
ncbi:peptidoglycan-binding protein [Streptomyces lichenis]|uniref:Peptidoglycan-binding protein n=1 Tax=Streptomyces lichenis TaxID=2306967 RepID=A0ABT0I5L4_9ACTN|nr:peptidoglycan-binding protein [Streptomyces lichenis]MCK8676601.1 peptidoglycan-binding protein [Streptomyces lichenis]